MRRLLAIILIVAPLAGCKGPAPTMPPPIDPFFGRTRVEPPRTTWLGPRLAADPAYSQPAYLRAAPAYAPTAPPVARQGWMPIGAAPQPSAGQVAVAPASPRPGATPSFSGDRIAIPTAALALTDPPATSALASTPSPPAALPEPPAAVVATPAAVAANPVPSLPPAAPSVPTSPSVVSLAGRERILQTLGPRPRAADPAPAAASPGVPSSIAAPPAPSVPGGVINLTELPLPTRSAGTVPAASAVVPAAFSEPR